MSGQTDTLSERFDLVVCFLANPDAVRIADTGSGASLCKAERLHDRLAQCVVLIEEPMYDLPVQHRPVRDPADQPDISGIGAGTRIRIDLPLIAQRTDFAA